MSEMEKDLPYLEKLRPLIEAVAESFELEPAVVAAVISRESGGGRLLGKNGCPPDTGDQGHGRGLMQIDDRWHQSFLAIPGFWRRPPANLAYGCYLLQENLQAVTGTWPRLSYAYRLRAALAAYNAGLSRVFACLRAGKDVDLFTSGNDYSRDVLRRADWLRARGWK